MGPPKPNVPRRKKYNVSSRNVKDSTSVEVVLELGVTLSFMRVSFLFVSEIGQQLFAHLAATVDSLLVFRTQMRNPRDLRSEARRLGAPKLAVFDVDVVDELGQTQESGVAQIEARTQHLEGALVSLVRKLGLEHVEPQLIAFRLVALSGNELE